MGNSIPPFTDCHFVNSRELDRDALKRAGCFMTFRARINIRDDLANTGMIRADKDWATAKNQQWNSNTIGCSFSPVRNMTSFLCFESLPYRMEVLSYLNELAFVHDGMISPSIARTVVRSNNHVKTIRRHWIPSWLLMHTNV
jgi:hypothetical protein